MKLAPGYIVIILWVIFTFMLLGWILAASLSTTTDIFAGKALKFPTGLHFENYIQFNVIFPDIMFPADPDLCTGSICTGEIHISGK